MTYLSITGTPGDDSVPLYVNTSKANTTPDLALFANNTGNINIVDHGVWESYIPDNIAPELKGAGVLFSRRKKDGIDWYDFSRDPSNFGPASILATVVNFGDKWRVMTILLDRSLIFPANHRVIEIQNYNGSLDKVHKNWEYQFYDVEKKVIGNVTPTIDDLIVYAQVQKKIIEEGGITVDGYAVATDRASQAMITQTVLSIQLNPAIKINWKGPDGKFTVLDNKTIVGLAMFVITHVAKTFDVLAGCLDDIRTYQIQSYQQVDKYLKDHISTVFSTKG